MSDSKLSLDDYLSKYGQHLADRARQSLQPLHTPGTDPLNPAIDTFTRRPFDAQAHVISGVVKALDRQKGVFIVGEMGTGKSLMGACAAHAHAAGKPYRALIFCPGHLPVKWKREILSTIPEAKVRIIERWSDALALYEKKGTTPTGPEWYIIARDRAKLGAKWATIDGCPIRGADHKVMRCPSCGAVQKDKNDLSIVHDAFKGKKKFCDAVVRSVDGRRKRPCGEALWTYTREMSRWEPAKFFHKKMRGFFDYLLLDEVHEEKSATSAQANAAGSLIAASRHVIALTGTLIGGYADHLRPLLFRLCPRTLVEEGFGWNDVMPFSEKYGKIEEKTTTTSGGFDASESNSQSRGSSRSTTRYVRPGVLPSIFGRHLIGNTVFLLLDEVADNLPELEEVLVPVEMGAKLGACYEGLESKLREEIRSLIQRKGPGGAGKLLGPMLNALLCYPDHPFDWKLIGYNDKEGFHPVVRPVELDRNVTYPKEEALIEYVMGEYNSGRQVWVFAVYNGERDVQGRLATMLRKKGLRVAELRQTVPPAEREAWISANGPMHDVILSGPKLVETGLDLFDRSGRHNYSTLCFYETGYNLFTLRQASRRAWRIGQKSKCRVAYFFYKGTMQEQAMTLMGRKMAAATAIDGRFTTDGLVGMAEDDSIEMAMAKSLADNMQEDASREWERLGAGEPKVADDDEDLFRMLDSLEF